MSLSDQINVYYRQHITKAWITDINEIPLKKDQRKICSCNFYTMVYKIYTLTTNASKV